MIKCIRVWGYTFAVSGALATVTWLVGFTEVAWSNAWDEEMEVLGAESLYVDARPFEVYSRGRVIGAAWLDATDWENSIEGFLSVWDPDVSTVLYCGGHGCGKAKDAYERLVLEFGGEEFLSRVRVTEVPAWALMNRFGRER